MQWALLEYVPIAESVPERKGGVESVSECVRQDCRNGRNGRLKNKYILVPVKAKKSEPTTEWRGGATIAAWLRLMLIVVAKEVGKGHEGERE